MKNKKIMIPLIVLALLLILIFSIHKLTYDHDKRAIEKGNSPTFVIVKEKHLDGKPKVYYGIGYEVLRWYLEVPDKELKMRQEIYKYPNFKDWADGPEDATQYFDYKH